MQTFGARRFPLVVFVTLALAMPIKSAEAQVEQAGWVSLGLGRGWNSYFSGGLSGVAAGWYSAGPFVAGIRKSDTAASGLLSSSDDHVGDTAGLIGLRTPGHRAILLGALGYGRVQHTYGSGTRPDDPAVSALAYSLQASANYRYVGVAAELFGAAGGTTTSFHGVAISVQLGSFGR